MRITSHLFAGACALAVLAGSGCSKSEDDPDAFARDNYCAEVVATVAEGSYIHHVEVDGDRLYYTSNDGFVVMDNTDKSHPIQIMRWPGGSGAFAIENNIAVLDGGRFTDGDAILDIDLYMERPDDVSAERSERVFDDSIISSLGMFYINPPSYSEEAGLQTYDPTGQIMPYRVQVSKGWWWFSAAIEGNTLATGGNGGLDLFDIGDPLRPRWLASAKPSELILWLAISNHTVYAAGYDFVGSEEDGWAIYDIADPKNPRMIDSYNNRSVYELYSSEQFLVLYEEVKHAENNISMDTRIYDIADRLRPKWIGIYDPIGSPKAMDGDTLYLALNEGGLQILDLSGCRAQEE